MDEQEQDPTEEQERYERFRNIVEQYPVDVLLGDALVEAERTLREFVVLPEPAYPTLALWTAHTFFVGYRQVTPYVSLHSATLREGKTRTMEVAEVLTQRPVVGANLSTAALYRTINDERPTLLLDEQDATVGMTQDFRRILNSGYRSSGWVARVVSGRAERFSTFCPKMFAGIGVLPDTLRDRSIEVRLRRALPEEQDRLGRLQTNKTAALKADHRAMLQVLANKHGQRVGDAEPLAPSGLKSARAVEVWEPLWALADLAEGDWPERSRAAALELQQEDPRDEKVALLADIQSVFGTRDRVSSAEIIAYVDSREGVYEGPPLRNGKALAMMLRAFEVRPTHSRVGSGYDRAAFEDAWRRYL
jgi:hypothetical protein